MQNVIKGHGNDDENSKYDYVQCHRHSTATTTTKRLQESKGWETGEEEKGVDRNERKSPRDVPLVIIIIESFIPGLSFSVPLRWK